ncbi:MAG: hypothetical protein IKI04_01685 [Bacilli bacterium]|nr:hypothetical protein [Bacilli bacterium]
MNKVIFKHELKDAYQIPLSSIYITDSDKDNVIIDNEKYSIDKESINTIKESLNDDKLYTDNEVLFPPVLDGTLHKILLSGNKTKEIECFNLWYWTNEEINSVKEDMNKEDLEYTKSILKLIDIIQNILDDNNIDYYILDDSE